jgi:hypothetical protein
MEDCRNFPELVPHGTLEKPVVPARRCAIGARYLAPAQIGKEPPMTEQNDNYETQPAVEPSHYDGPTKKEQRVWNWGTTTLIAVVSIIFLAIIIIYAVTR